MGHAALFAEAPGGAQEVAAPLAPVERVA